MRGLLMLVSRAGRPCRARTVLRGTHGALRWAPTVSPSNLIKRSACLRLR